ncbi:MAG: SDR family oxidoreductase [Alphaproteobacteria bacterium]|nr:SDR family oxidoreductase [Alphaproteobacteria bacterium]
MSAQSVLIAGASRGIGLELARQYASDGWRVVACCREPKKALELQAISKNVQCERLDIVEAGSISALAGKLGDARLDLLIVSAGMFSSVSGVTASDIDPTQCFGSLDTDGWLKILRTNTVAPVMVAEAFRRNLKGGKLVFLSSRMGSIERIRRPGDIAYRSSKAALNAAMKSISFDLKKDETIAVCLHPGFVKTETGGAKAEIMADESVRGMRKVIASLTLENTGQFFNYDGQVLPW